MDKAIARPISRIPQTTSAVLLTMAADIPGRRESAELMAEYAEERAGAGEYAEALDWFSRIVEGGEPELAPHAAFRMGLFLADVHPEAAQAALIYAVAHGSREVMEAAKSVIAEFFAERDLERRTAAPAVEEVVGLGALGRGALAILHGDLEMARAAYEHAAGSSVADIAAEGLTRLGSCLGQLGDADAAAGTLKQVIDGGRPRFALMAAGELAALLARQGQTGQAMALFREIARGEGQEAANARMNLGLILLQQGDGSGVQELEAVADGPDLLSASAALFNLGVHFEDEGFPRKAQECYERGASLRAFPFSARAALNLGVLLSRGGDYDGALRAWRLAEEMGDPEQAGKARSLIANVGEAASLMDPAAMLDPGVSAQANLMAAEQALEQGDIGMARRLYEQVMDAGHPKFAPRAAANIALLFWLAQSQGEEEADSEQIAGIVMERFAELGHPGLAPRGWFEFGKLMARSGRWEDAEAVWRRAGGESQRHGASSSIEPAVRWLVALIGEDDDSLAAAEAHLVERQAGGEEEVAADMAEAAVSGALDVGEGALRADSLFDAEVAFARALLLAERFDVPELAGQAREALESLKDSDS